MQTLFICTGADCLNKDIEYYFDGVLKTAECGGCHKTLKGKKVELVVEEAPIVAE